MFHPHFSLRQHVFQAVEVDNIPPSRANAVASISHKVPSWVSTVQNQKGQGKSPLSSPIFPSIILGGPLALWFVLHLRDKRDH